MTPEQVTALQTTVEKQQEQINFLLMQVQYLFNRLQLAPLDIKQVTGSNDRRTETGMGAIVTPEKSSYL